MNEKRRNCSGLVKQTKANEDVFVVPDSTLKTSLFLNVVINWSVRDYQNRAASGQFAMQQKSTLKNRVC
nr:hypothetical protein [uncultured Undibacterium sp.]